MDRDIVERLEILSMSSTIHFERVALTMDQIEEHDPPPQWAKAADSRSPQYVFLYGEDVWELDALEPRTLAEVVEASILQYRDVDLHDELMKLEDSMRADMTQFHQDYQERLDDGDLWYIPDWYKELAYGY